MKTELERMVPNMKAMERLADVEAGLQDAEREAEDTRRESKTAKDKYLELRKKRLVRDRCRRATLLIADASSSIKPMGTCPVALTRSTKI